MNEQKDKYDIELPQSIIESFARFLIQEIKKDYRENEQTKKTLCTPGTRGEQED